MTEKNQQVTKYDIIKVDCCCWPRIPNPKEESQPKVRIMRWGQFNFPHIKILRCIVVKP